MFNRLMVLVVGLSWLLAAGVARAGFDEDLLQLQRNWAVAKYQLAGAEQKTQFSHLVDQAEALAAANAQRAEGWLWAGTIKSSLAKATGGLAALPLVKSAKTDLEKAIAIDGKVLGGSAYTILGALYNNVPGWPVAFGDKKKAQELLQQGLAISPDDIDANFFYAEYLYDRGDYNAAQQHAERALQAPARPRLPLADQGRHAELRALLEKIAAKTP